jgi:glycosyltransferase involved in cell wall biosynthesis
MNIALILDPYGEKTPGGLGRAIFEMAKSIIESDPTHSYTVYVKQAPQTPPNIGGKWQLKRLEMRSLFFSIPRMLSRRHDIYLFLNPIVPLFFFPKKSIVVVHDFAYLEIGGRTIQEKFKTGALYLAHWLSLHKATKIVAVSHAAKESTIQYFGVDQKKIQVIYNGFIASESASEAIDVPNHFFLFAGVLKERKNVHGIIRAFAEFQKNHKDFFLVIAGKCEGTYAEAAVALAKKLGIAEQVKFVGYVTDAQLAYLYTKAVALVFPSFIEGFGMPILEAMDKGLPVITSNTGALAEVAGDAALLVNPHNPDTIAAAMMRIASDPQLKAALIERGNERARQFSWEKTAQQFHRVIVSLPT